MCPVCQTAQHTKAFSIHLQILERKNSEIEELKTLYKKKQNEMEETITKLEKKGDVVLLHKSCNNIVILFQCYIK